nr:TOBE domain-containing protein [Acidiferrobacterales bacterium]
IVVSDSDGVRCKVRGVEYLGADMLVDCALGESTFLARVPGSSELISDDEISLSWDLSRAALFNAGNGKRMQAA